MGLTTSSCPSATVRRAPVPLFGYTGSPALAGNLLITAVGGERGGTIMAFHKDSGRVVWKSLGEDVSYSSPVIARLGGLAQVVAMTGPRVVGLDLATGRLLWSHPFQIQYDESISTPVVADDLVLVTGDRRPLTALRITRKSDDWQNEVAWTNDVLSSYLSSMLVHEGHVYGMNDGGEFACVRLSDGKTIWTGGSHGYYCSPVLAGRRLIALNEQGELAVLAADPAAYRPLGTTRLAQRYLDHARDRGQPHLCPRRRRFGLLRARQVIALGEEGVGSLFRSTGYLSGQSSAEKDSRPLTSSLDGESLALAFGGPVETNAFERLVNFVERFLAEVGDAQQILAFALQEIVDREDASLLEAVGGSHGKPDFGGAHLQPLGQFLGLFLNRAKWNATHQFPP